MIKPVSYSQKDPKWANNDYSAKGEKTTIKASGCGPTCMAMVIATLKNKLVTPKTTAAWALKKGYKAPNQGTYYSYFAPQGKAYGIDVSMLNPSNLTKLTAIKASSYHAKAVAAIEKGNFVICCMGKGRWTSSGHYILWYGMDGSNVLINDPNSTAANKVKAPLSLLQKEVKYYFIVDVLSATKDTKTAEATVLAKKAASIVKIDNLDTLIRSLVKSYSSPCWWVIDKLTKLDYTGKTAIAGKGDIYRRTLLAIKVAKPTDYNNDLLKVGKGSIFYTIKKLLDQYGIE